MRSKAISARQPRRCNSTSHVNSAMKPRAFGNQDTQHYLLNFFIVREIRSAIHNQPPFSAFHASRFHPSDTHALKKTSSQRTICYTRFPSSFAMMSEMSIPCHQFLYRTPCERSVRLTPESIQPRGKCYTRKNAHAKKGKYEYGNKKRR